MLVLSVFFFFFLQKVLSNFCFTGQTDKLVVCFPMESCSTIKIQFCHLFLFCTAVLVCVKITLSNIINERLEKVLLSNDIVRLFCADMLKTFFRLAFVPEIYFSQCCSLPLFFGSVWVSAFMKSGSRLNKRVKFCSVNAQITWGKSNEGFLFWFLFCSFSLCRICIKSSIELQTVLAYWSNLTSFGLLLLSLMWILWRQKDPLSLTNYGHPPIL